MSATVIRPDEWWSDEARAARVLRHFHRPETWVPADAEHAGHMKALGDMQRLGYVRLRPDTDDHAGAAKGVWVSLTDKGRAAVQTHFPQSLER